jgi:hypothetical protein
VLHAFALFDHTPGKSHGIDRADARAANDVDLNGLVARFA